MDLILMYSECQLCKCNTIMKESIDIVICFSDFQISHYILF